MIRVLYEIHMEVETSESTDLLHIMDNMALAIERARMEGEITGVEDTETLIGAITLSYVEG